MHERYREHHSFPQTPPPSNFQGLSRFAQHVLLLLLLPHPPSLPMTRQVVSITVGDHKVDASELPGIHEGTGVIVDSGTTDTYMPPSLLPVINAAWRPIMNAVRLR